MERASVVVFWKLVGGSPSPSRYRSFCDHLYIHIGWSDSSHKIGRIPGTQYKTVLRAPESSSCPALLPNHSPRPPNRPLPPRRPIDLNRPLLRAADTADVQFSLHAFDRAEEREEQEALNIEDALDILRTGFIVSQPARARNGWMCKVIKNVLGNRDAGVVTLILTACDKLRVITVEWEDR